MQGIGRLDRIYQAATTPARWNEVLHAIAVEIGCKGAVVFATNGGATYQVATPGVAELAARYFEEGWADANERGAPMIAAAHPWFVTDTDLHTPEAMAEMPVYRDLLIPIGMDAAAGTVVQGAHNDLIALTFEGFSSHVAARHALDALDELRPHLARALALSSQIELARLESMVDGLHAIGTPAAIIGGSGRLRAANALFADTLGHLVYDLPIGVRFAEPMLQRGVAAALEALGAGASASASVPLDPERLGGVAWVAHLSPMRFDSRYGASETMLILSLSAPKNLSFAQIDVIRSMFDLTRAEARLCYEIAAGKDLKQAAAACTITYATARVHLRSIFFKTGVRRQAELVSLMRSWF